MQGLRNRPRPRLNIPQHKHVDFVQSPNLTGGTLTPDLPQSPPVFPTNESNTGDGVLKVDNYLLTKLLDTQGHVKIYKAFHSTTHVEHVCKVRSNLLCDFMVFTLHYIESCLYRCKII